MKQVYLIVHESDNGGYGTVAVCANNKEADAVSKYLNGLDGLTIGRCVVREIVLTTLVQIKKEYETA